MRRDHMFIREETMKLLKTLAGAAAALSILAASAVAQTYPERSITMVVPFSAGGPTDTVARLVAESMSKDLGQQIIVENVGGEGHDHRDGFRRIVLRLGAEGGADQGDGCDGAQEGGFHRCHPLTRVVRRFFIERRRVRNAGRDEFQPAARSVHTQGLLYQQIVKFATTWKCVLHACQECF